MGKAPGRLARAEVVDQTPWQEIFRRETGQLATGACLEFALAKRAIARKMPRHNH